MAPGTMLACGHALERGREAFVGITKRCLDCASQRIGADRVRNDARGHDGRVVRTHRYGRVVNAPV